MPRLTPEAWRKWQKETVDPDFAEKGKARLQRMDLGLALLSIARDPGAQFSREEVAAWCGVPYSMIGWYEQKAIAKLRQRLTQIKDPRLREAMDHYFDRLRERQPAEPVRTTSADD